MLGKAIGERTDQSLVNEAYQDMIAKHGSELHAPDVMIHSDQGHSTPPPALSNS